MRKIRNQIIANIFGALVLVASAYLTFIIAFRLRDAKDFELYGTTSVIVQLVILVVATVLMLIVHEGFHGLGFWIFTGSKPMFAIKPFYAYAAAPDWYLPKWQYFLTALAPFIAIPLLGFLGIAIGPRWSLIPLMAVIVFNAAGAVGDLWVAGALLLRAPTVLANDNGDVVSFYEPGTEAELDGGDQS
jgi:hypothetical protein